MALALDAELEAARSGSFAPIPASEFFEGTWTTVLEPRNCSPPSTSRYGKVGAVSWSTRSRAGAATSLAGVVCAVEFNAAGAVSRSAIGLFGMGATPVRAVDAEAALDGTTPTATRARRSRRGSRSAAALRPTTCTRRPSTAHTSARISCSAPSTEPWEKRGVAEHAITLTVNGERRHGSRRGAQDAGRLPARGLGLTGTHLGCEHGVCGACTVLVDGDAVRSCLMFAVQAEGADIVDHRGHRPADGSLGPVQEAFRQAHGLQCGFCTPGFVVSVHAFLRGEPEPHPRRDPRGAVGQPVSLHRLPGDHQGGADRGGDHERQVVEDVAHVDADDRLRPPTVRWSSTRRPRRRAPKGAVIVIQEAFGVNDHIQDVTRRFAAAGYHAVAPAMFHRAGAAPRRTTTSAR